MTLCMVLGHGELGLYVDYICCLRDTPSRMMKQEHRHSSTPVSAPVSALSHTHTHTHTLHNTIPQHSTAHSTAALNAGRQKAEEITSVDREREREREKKKKKKRITRHDNRYICIQGSVQDRVEPRDSYFTVAIT